uniref:C-Jun-amino-terminal kinase-interacting protein 4 n=1 Tax=Sphaerodactylus townsendi TaxID=933632 RepID=A0ACB8EKQ6_9SAUR
MCMRERETLWTLSHLLPYLSDELSDSQAGSKSTTPISDAPALAETPLNESSEGLVKSSDTGDKKTDTGKHIEVQVAQETRNVSIGSNENEDKSEVQAIIESTPELDMDKDLSGYKDSSTPTKGIENKAFDRNTESLFEELSSAGSGLIGDVDEGADLLEMKQNCSVQLFIEASSGIKLYYFLIPRRWVL